MGIPAWAGAWGRDGVPEEGAAGDSPGTSGAAPAPPLGTRQVCTLVGEQREKVPPAASRCSPAQPTPPSGPLRGASPAPPLPQGGRRPRPLRPPGSLSLQPGRGPATSSVPSGVHRALGGAQGKQRPVEADREAGVPGAPADFSSGWLPDAGPRAATRPGERARPAILAPGAVPYLRGSCREGRRGSARIPGLNVLPLSPYPSIQLGLLPLASPWKKSLEEKKRKINHAAEKGQPRSAGGSSEPGGSVPLGRGRPARPPPPRASLPRPPFPRVPSNVGAAPPPQPPRGPPPRARVSARRVRGGVGGQAGRGPRRRGSDAGRGSSGTRARGRRVRPGSPTPGAAQAEEAQPQDRLPRAPLPHPTCKYPTRVDTALAAKPQDPVSNQTASRSRH